MRLRHLLLAEQEIEQITLWYGQQRLGLAEDFLKDLSRTLIQIENHPRRFAKVEGLSSKREIRGLSLDSFPFTVVYEVFKTETVVLAVAHHHRRANYWKNRKH